MSEPVTHYDGNDSHGYKMTDVLDPGDVAPDGSRYPDEASMEAEMDKLAYLLERENIVYIKGVAFRLESWGEMQSDGSRAATLKIWQPF